MRDGPTGGVGETGSQGRESREWWAGQALSGRVCSFPWRGFLTLLLTDSRAGKGQLGQSGGSRLSPTVFREPSRL